MNCKHARDLILTDYIDGEMSLGAARQMEAHLLHCPSCRLLAQNVRKDTEVLKTRERETVDESVWRRIQGKIQSPEPIRSAGVGWADIVRNFIYSFRPAMAVALCLAVILGITLISPRPARPGSYLVYMMGTEAQAGDEVTTGIENYFL